MKINNKYISGNIEFDKKNVKLVGNKIYNKTINIIAPNPPDTLGNYSGTALPFPNIDIAFENTVNKFKIQSNNIDIILKYPNSYNCLSNGKHKVPPTIFISDENNENTVKIELEDNCPTKTLVSRNYDNKPEFYNDKYHALPVSTGFKTMINYANYKVLNNKG